MDEITSPLKAIRAKCLDCCCGSVAEVRKCTAESCPLYPFRLGSNPYRAKRELSEEQKANLASQFQRYRENSTKQLGEKP